MCCGTEAGSYLRLIDSCITLLKAQGTSRTRNESKEEERERGRDGKGGSLCWSSDSSISLGTLAAAGLSPLSPTHSGGNPGANLKSISHICHPILVAFVWALTKETIDLPLGCLQGGSASGRLLVDPQRERREGAPGGRSGATAPTGAHSRRTCPA